MFTGSTTVLTKSTYKIEYEQTYCEQKLRSTTEGLRELSFIYVLGFFALQNGKEGAAG